MTSPEKLRLDRLLANMGYGSRKDIQALVRAGRVVLDGAPVRDADDRIAVTADLPSRMTISGKPLDPLPGLALMMHKPLGVTCSHKEAGPLVYALLPERWRARKPPISTIGRLDKETSGLLLLTDDGQLLHRAISPKSNVSKRYVARLARPLRGDEARILASGTLMLEAERTPLLPVAMEVISESSDAADRDTWEVRGVLPLEHPARELSLDPFLGKPPAGARATAAEGTSAASGGGGPLVRVTLTEGRYHQVRRMFAALGNHVVTLHRDRFGGLQLPADLAPGEWRILDAAGIALIFTA